MPAGAMPDRDQAAKIEIIRLGLAAQRIRRGRDIAERAGVAAAGPIDPAIVDVPHRIAAFGEIIGDPVHDRPVGNVGRPAAAMDKKHGRVRALAAARGEPEVGDLERIGAVRNGAGRDGARAGEQSGPGHHGGLGLGGGCGCGGWGGREQRAGGEGGGDRDGKDRRTHGGHSRGAGLG